MIISDEQMKTYRQQTEAGFTQAVVDQMCDEHDDFKALTPRQQEEFVSTCNAWARHFGFSSERALAFWSNVTWVLPSSWQEKPALQTVLQDWGPSEPERLFRLKETIGQIKWTG